VVRYDGSTGAFVDAFVAPGSGGLVDAFGLVFGSDGNLYVSNSVSGSILRYDGTTGHLQTPSCRRAAAGSTSPLT
jgi:hypothetical protein